MTLTWPSVSTVSITNEPQVVIPPASTGEIYRAVTAAQESSEQGVSERHRPPTCF